ncbi:MAG: hypothetical protein M3Y87_18780, partial [Myxococcota bacterium]|nr:hypothetical protein [Myxococcota bacterium]
MSTSVLRALAVFLLLLGTSARAFAAPPTATTTPATSITTSSAVLNGSGTPSGEPTTGWFRISATNPVTCNDTFGTRVPATSGTDLGSGAVAVPYSITTIGLTSGVTYFFCAIVANASGTAFGAVQSFTVPGAPITTTTGAASVLSTSATLEGSADPVAAATTGWFRYATSSPGTCNDTFGTRAPTSSGSLLGSGTAPVDYNRIISSLLPGTTYHYCAIASNAHGTTFGAVMSFTTPGTAPTVSTSSATSVTGSSAQLNGSGVPRGDAAIGYFRYSTTSPGSCNDSFGTRAPTSGGTALGSGNTSTAFSQSVTGLSAGTTYYFCAIADNSYGTGLGSVLSFVTPAAPTVITSSATSVTSTSATLNGSGNPNRAATTGYFRYATTSPGTCNDTFGSRAPTSGGSSLGAGTTSVAFSRSITGLSAGTTYYYCAIAENAEGTAFGAVLSLTTLASPVVTTSAATLVTATSATLNGAADPNGATTSGWFRYSTSDPGTCNDSFGSRAPTSSGSALGSGTTAVAYSRAISSLTPATTYYYCAIASNAYGTSYGAVLSFTTPAAAPTVSTGSASLLTGSTAQLNGSSNPGGAATTGWFRYATTSPGTCNDSFGTRAPASGGTALGAGTTSTAFSQGITGLSPGTTYYYCALASSSVATTFGSIVSFITPAAPTAVTSSATSITSTSATLNGSGNPNRAATTGYFRYDTTSPGTCNDTFGSRAPTTSGSALGSGSASVAFSRSITGLSPGATYYYCAITTNAEGTAFGAVLSFTTLATPAVITNPATLVASTSATLNGSADPNGATSSGWFRYSTANPGACNDTFGSRAPTSSGTALGSGTSPVAYTRAIASLVPATTYYYCAIASNTYGTSYGDVLSFTTPSALPTVSTSSASLLTGSTAQLNGTSNAGGDATTAWFRYATASPGTCNDSFGTRAPSSGGTAIGSGTTSVAFSQGITGLAPGTTYYYCALASNSGGTALGSVVSFITPAAPTAVTSSATSITSTSATLNGSGNPNRAATTGYFRYDTTSPGTCNDTFGSRAPTTSGSSLGSGSASVAFSRSITGLSPGATYYYCAITTNAEGTAFGAVLSFTTLATPAVITNPATLVASTSATLNGSADPNGATSSGWFRYSTANPGACNDTFGSRAPTSSGTALGSGTSPVAYTRAIASLVPATTYYYCAIASNTYGT